MQLDVEALYLLLDKQRREREMNWASMAREIGCSPQVLHRIERGKPPSGEMLLRILDWLGQGYDLTPFLKPGASRPSAP